MLQEFLNRLIEAGVKPNWLGTHMDNGTLLEYRSLPWVAGKDLFVLVQEVNKPETLYCEELKKVRPVELIKEENAA